MAAQKDQTMSKKANNQNSSEVRKIYPMTEEIEDRGEAAFWRGVELAEAELAAKKQKDKK